MPEVVLPQLGESVTEGTITRWFKSVGDTVTEDEPLFEVSTDKVDSEVPSPVSGYLTEILVPEGETVDVGTKLAVVSDAPGEGGVASDGGAEAGGEAAAAAPAEEPVASAPAPAPAAEAPAPSAPEPAPAAVPPAADSAAGGGAGVLLSPVVRRLVQDAGIDPAQITGTGVGGRITRADVENHIRSTGGARSAAGAAPTTAAPAPAPAATTSTRSRPLPTVSVAAGADAPVPLNKIRQITAGHMVRSLEVSAHAYVGTEVDFEAIERVRRANKDQFKADEGVSLTYMPFVSRALVDALAEFPLVNASMGEETAQIVVHGSVNLGIAVDLDHEGLIVPVIHNAQDQRLRAIARNVADVAGRAKARKLTADDISGGTVTITNIGMTGNTFLLPVINQPQVMILSTDGVKRRPVVVTDGSGGESIAIHSVGNLTLGWDHRAFDGAYAAQFLERVKEILETRDWSAEL